MSLVKQEDRAKYTRFIWVFYLAFPFVMQGFKPEDIRSNKAAYILPVTAQLNFNGKAIKLEVARSKFAVTHGLTYRNDIDNDRGMLYQPDTPISYFTGRSMRFSTALIFIKNNKVVDIQQVQSCSDRDSKCLEYRTNFSHDEVMEVKVNVPSLLGITIGSLLNINYVPQTIK